MAQPARKTRRSGQQGAQAPSASATPDVPPKRSTAAPVKAGPSRMLSPADVAALLQVSIKTVRRWIETGELHVHTLGRQLRVSDDDLNTFVKSRRK